MTARDIEFTANARLDIAREQTWWVTHRDHPERFRQALTDAYTLIASTPGVGTPYRPRIGVRRLYLKPLDLHLYYTCDDETVLVRALWGARRGRGPSL